jgi:hypothetical protein
MKVGSLDHLVGSGKQPFREVMSEFEIELVSKLGGS